MSEADIEAMMAEMRKWSEYPLGHTSLSLLQVDDAFFDLIRANGFYDKSRPMREFGETQQQVDTFFRDMAFGVVQRQKGLKHSGLGKGLFHMRWRVGKDDKARDCIFVEFHKVTYEGEGSAAREKLELASQMPVPLAILAAHLGPLRDPAYVERSRVTREFLKELGPARPDEPRFWRAMLESFAVFFPRGPVAVIAAPAAAPATPSRPPVPVASVHDKRPVVGS